MSHRQARRPQGQSDQEGIKYGDVFDVMGLTSPTPTTGDLRWTAPTPTPTPSSSGAVDQSAVNGTITIGEALEATALSVGDKPVDQGDAAAIQAAEARAGGLIINVTQPSGLGATARDAATHNARVASDYNMITISDVLSNAASKLPQDKQVTREDADGVTDAELGNKPFLMTTPGGVADTIATAARVNREHDNP